MPVSPTEPDVPVAASSAVRQHAHEPDGPVALGNHACVLYEDVAETLPFAVPYLIDGLARNERCLVVTGEQPPEVFVDALLAAGVEVSGAEARGALVVVPIWDESVSAATFDPEAMIDTVRRVVEEARTAGFQGLRLVADMTWALQRQIDRERLLTYEALGTHLLRTIPMQALCLYHRGRSSPGLIRDALRTHPNAIVDGRVCPNFYYEPPELVTGTTETDAAAERVEWMIGRLVAARETEEIRVGLLAAEAARVELEAALTRRARFASGISHDLRTPLATIKGQAQLLRRRAERQPLSDSGWLWEGLTRIDGTVGKMQALLDELVDAARIQAGHALELSRQPTDLVALVRACVDDQQQRTDRHTLDIRLTRHIDALVGEWDGQRLERVVNNILSNAVKYSPAGGPVIVLLGREQDDTGASAVITVQDTGVGIPAADLAHITEYFHRGANVRGKIDGTGIGLAGSRHIVEQHGGSFRVESVEGAGTTVIIRLPLE